MHRVKGDRDPFEAIHTRGVEGHSANIKPRGDARDCISDLSVCDTNKHKGVRDLSRAVIP